MTRRFTETGKWDDPWFRRLSPAAKLLFQFICDRCDCAGFWEIDLDAAAFHIGIPRTGSDLTTGPAWTADAALDELCVKPKGYASPKVRLNQDKSWLYVTNFLHHQGNWPLNPKNNSTTGILRCFASRGEFGDAILAFLQQRTSDGVAKSIQSLSEGPSKDLPRTFQGGVEDLERGPGKGKGNSNGNGNGNSSGEEGCGGKGGDSGAPADIVDLSPVANSQLAKECRKIIKAWNKAVPGSQQVPPEGTPAIDRAYSGLAISTPRIGLSEILAAIENYREALRLPKSQAHAHSLGGFLRREIVEKYAPGVFNLKNFDASRFARDGPNGNGTKDAGAEFERLKTLGVV